MVEDKLRGGGKVGVLLKLDLKEMGKDISHLSSSGATEGEILLLPGMKFQVTAVEQNQTEGFTEVTASQVVAPKNVGPDPAQDANGPAPRQDRKGWGRLGLGKRRNRG